MENKYLLTARVALLVEKLNEEELDEAKRKLYHKELMDLQSEITKMEQVENTQRELDLRADELNHKLKNEKFNKTMEVVKNVGLPILKGVSMAVFTIGVIQITNNFEKDGYYSTSTGKSIGQLPGKLIGNIIRM